MYGKVNNNFLDFLPQLFPFLIASTAYVEPIFGTFSYNIFNTTQYKILASGQIQDGGFKRTRALKKWRQTRHQHTFSTISMISSVLKTKNTTARTVFTRQVIRYCTQKKKQFL